MWQTIQMGILAVVVLAPMWIFAQELDSGEFTKTAVGLVSGYVVMAAIRIIESSLVRNKE